MAQYETTSPQPPHPPHHPTPTPPTPHHTTPVPNGGGEWGGWGVKTLGFVGKTPPPGGGGLSSKQCIFRGNSSQTPTCPPHLRSRGGSPHPPQNGVFCPSKSQRKPRKPVSARKCTLCACCHVHTVYTRVRRHRPRLPPDPTTQPPFWVEGTPTTNMGDPGTGAVTTGRIAILLKGL